MVVRPVCEEQESLGHHAGLQVRQQLQAHGAGAARPLDVPEAQVAAASVLRRTAVGTWTQHARVQVPRVPVPMR